MRVHGQVTDGEGVALPGAVVTVLSLTGLQLARRQAEPDGSYSVGLDQDSEPVVLVASAPGRAPWASLLTPAPGIGDITGDVDVVLDGPAAGPVTGVLAGSVALAASGVARRAVADSGRAPELDPAAPGAAVTLLDIDGRVVDSATVTPPAEFAFRALPPGSYVLAVAARGYRASAEPVSVPAGAETRHEVELVSCGRLAGVVRNADQRPVPDALVRLLDESGTLVGLVLTGVDGRYEFVELPAGLYTVLASGYPARTDRVRVSAADGATQHDVVLGYGDSLVVNPGSPAVFDAGEYPGPDPADRVDESIEDTVARWQTAARAEGPRGADARPEPDAVGTERDGSRPGEWR